MYDPDLPTVDLRYTPRPWQTICHRSRTRFSIRVLHRRAGKTELGMMELIDAALGFNQELGAYVYVAPLLKQAKRIVWTRLKHRLRPLIEAKRVAVRDGDDLTVTCLNNGATIQLYGADNPDGLRGVRLDGAVIDEVAQMKPVVWEEIIQPALADREGWATFIGTPHGVNVFSELHYKALSPAAQRDGWSTQLFTVYDTDTLNPKEVERLRRDMSDQAFSREFLCDFAAAGDDQLISLVDVELACQREYKTAEYDYAPTIIGVDPARFGDDRSAIVIRQGLRCGPPIVFQGIDNMALAAKVAELIERLAPDAVFVDAGNGSGVIDRLRQLGHDVSEVPFGGSPNDPQYVNKRTEMWCEMADWVRAGGALPNDTGLKRDLAAPVYGFNMKGQKALESKDQIKARGLPSPDIGDALCLTFAHHVAKKPKGLLGVHNSPRREYDPYASV